jgi:hypothetical protein
VLDARSIAGEMTHPRLVLSRLDLLVICSTVHSREHAGKVMSSGSASAKGW